ncbi:MAG: acyclic terpene utilization AtuA family protein [Acetatifactor sp.]|nr:acyclic terpene utilization AtuA family protein [Acetatifactor sp.]
MKEVKIVAPCGILGYGFPKQSFLNGLEQEPDAVVVDAGSTDAGPHKLGGGVGIVSEDACRKDLELIITEAAKRDIPVIIGSAGGAGSRIHVQRTLAVIASIIHKHHLEELPASVIWSDIPKEFVREKLRQGRLEKLGNAVKELTGERLEETGNIVAQMGHESIVEALERGSRLIVCGRAYDPSPFAAVALHGGIPLEYGYHAGKILECAALCAEPGTTKDCMLGILREDGFIIEPLSDMRRCTPLSVAAHTFYEKEHPYLLRGPGIVMNLEDCDFSQHGSSGVMVKGSRIEKARVYQVKLEGAVLTAYRTCVIAGIRDPILISVLEEVERKVEEQTREYYSDVDADSYQIRFVNYGLNGVLGDAEPRAEERGHEVGVLFEATAATQELADAVCGTLRSTFLHYGYEGRKSTAGNLAFPYSPSDISCGPVYEFSVYHLMEIDEEERKHLFPIETLDWNQEA